MKKFLQASCLVAATLGVSVSAYAFTVEDMSAWSSTGQPLRMDIELSDLSVTQPSEVQVRVASASDFTRLGLTRPDWADSVRFEMLSKSGNRVVARAISSEAVNDDQVSLLVEIRTPSEGRLQQVGSRLGQQALADKNAKPAPAINERAAVKAVEPAPEAKPYNPAAESSKPVAVTPPQTKQKAVAKAEPVVEEAAVATPDEANQDREALELGLKAAKAQVADLEARLAALDATEAAAHTEQEAELADTQDAAELAAEESALDEVDIDAATEDATSELAADDMLLDQSEVEASTAESDESNAEALAAATATVAEPKEAPAVSQLKPHQLFARFMILVVGLILLVFFLFDKIRNRR